ncbi:hypothetical protein AGRA3207_005877 [Actinomadura graeca]|uniref:ABC transporter permease n=1 Tax=Actinomadura graeca TaxID=2750812 RepID=A0ABX8R491_9ACTN|nr:hypothetical protein [Actinomadura graeca]QXJ24537.1 hypothetical protein AGRA3207_005877 [Actinomadura graeca]
MILWMRAHNLLGILLGLAGMLGVVAISGGSTVPAPSLLQEALIGTPLALIVPLISVALLMHGLAGGPRELELVASRTTRRYRLMLVASVCACALGFGLLLTLSDVQPLGFAAGRNLTGYTGAALIGGFFLGRHGATAVPTAYLFLVILTGAPPDRVQVWVWPLADSGDVPAAAVSVITLAAGILLTCRNRRDPRQQL